MDKVYEKTQSLMKLIDNQFRETDQLKSYFLQSLIYYLAHILTDNHYLGAARLLSFILCQKEVFHSSRPNVPSY